MNDTTFANDPGYALDFFPSGSGSPFVIWRRANVTGNNPFNSAGDFTAIAPGTGATARQTLANDVPYTLTYTIERLSATDTRISVSVTGGALNNLNFTSVESSTTPNTAFDYFGFRVGGNAFAQKIKFTNWSSTTRPRSRHHRAAAALEPDRAGRKQRHHLGRRERQLAHLPVAQGRRARRRQRLGLDADAQPDERPALRRGQLHRGRLEPRRQHDEQPRHAQRQC